ncbi:erythromycin esterase family protein [Pseudomonas nitroreducens]|uniref:erythromycin esterase family protein n=1 Tax=Pseudomonas TaxID=286 RepID=UPI00030545D6|nr:erythromycin esterase family protein [Pseudomonas nitroreducens]
MPVTATPTSASTINAVLRRYAEPLADPGTAEFAAPFARLGDARVVLIGEASHGTAEFYQARAAITRLLIERQGFNIVAIEGDWPDAAVVDRQLRANVKPAGETPFTRFPSWMWRNREVKAFLAWLREHNSRLSADQRVEFRGLDIYSLRGSITEVLRYLDRHDPQQAAEARRRYACLTPWQDNPVSYGRAVLEGDESPCEEAVITQLNELLMARLEALDPHEDSFDAAQNARVVRAAEHYYRAMYRGGSDSWNLRDNHMFDTLRQVLRRRGPQAKAVVWAHNSHVGDAAATEMGWNGQFNLGQLCRMTWGDSAALVGMGTDSGLVAAADEWDGELTLKQVRPSLPDSWERQFLETGLPMCLVDWRQRPTLRQTLEQPLLERAIGVIYRPESERRSHYFTALLGSQFDAFLWFARTRAVTPLDSGSTQGEDQTYPFGL